MHSFADSMRLRETMARRDATRWLLAGPVAAVFIVIAAPALQAQSAANAREVYTEALKREVEIRREMDAHQAPEPLAPLLVRLRTLVGSYADMARLFPNNEQGDQALWQGAMLSADAFWRFGDEIDRASALNLLDALTTRFPDSAFVAQAAPHSRRLSDAPVLTPVPLIEQGPVVAAATPPAAETGRPTPAVSAPEPEPTAPPQTATAAPLPRIPEPEARVLAPQTPASPSPTDATRETPAPGAVARSAPEPIEPSASSSARAAGSQAASPSASGPSSPAARRPFSQPPADTTARVGEPGAVATSSTPAPPAAAIVTGPARLTSIQGEAVGEAIRFTLALEREVGIRHEQFGGPPRIVIDLHDTIPAETLTQALLPRDADVISRIRVGRHDGTWTRVVIELRAPSRYGIGVMREPYRVVIDVHPRLAGLSTDASVRGANARR